VLGDLLISLPIDERPQAQSIRRSQPLRHGLRAEKQDLLNFTRLRIVYRVAKLQPGRVTCRLAVHAAGSRWSESWMREIRTLAHICSRATKTGLHSLQ
jgi:hypothetical protein